MTASDVMLVPILYSELYGDKPSRSDLTAKLASYDWRHVVMISAGVPAIAWPKGIEDPRHQVALLAEFTRESSSLLGTALTRKLAVEPSRRVFTAEGFFSLIRVAIENQSAGSPLLANPNELLQAILIGNELTINELEPSQLTQTAKDLLKSEVRSTVLRLQNPHDLLARTDAFMHWNRSEKALKSENYLPLEHDFRRFSEISWLEHAAGAYGVLARYTAAGSWSDIVHNGVAFSLQQILQGFPMGEAVLRKWFSFNTVSLDELRSKWQAEQSLSIASAGPLWRRPVVETSDGLLFAPSAALLANAMGDGTYFALFDSYGIEAGDDSKKLQFSRLHGEFFQDYIFGRFSAGYDGRTDAQIKPEELYSGGMSPDVVIFEGNDVIFVEVVAKRMTMVDSILRLDEELIARDIELGVVKKARELHKHIEAFRRGDLFPDMPRPNGQRLYPLIVSPQDWPRITIISDVLPRVQAEESVLTDIEPLELLDVTEVENLELDLQGGLKLSELLDRKNRTISPHRMMSLNNYLIFVEPSTGVKGMSPARARGSEVAQDIMKLYDSWK